MAKFEKRTYTLINDIYQNSISIEAPIYNDCIKIDIKNIRPNAAFTTSIQLPREVAKNIRDLIDFYLYE